MVITRRGVVERNRCICANNLHKQSPSLTPHMGNIKYIRTVWPTVGILVPKFDFVEDRDCGGGDCGFWGGVIEVFL